MKHPPVAFVIMAGGRGERLWPLVRAEMPKVCLAIDGTRTLLQATLERLQPLARTSALLIVTTAAQAHPIRRTLPATLKAQLLVEPQPKNTAACISLAAAVLAHQDPTMVMVALPADHWITPTSAFQRSLLAAIEVAQDDDWLVTIGLKPMRVHPGLGHVCAGTALGMRRGCRVFRLARFVEKPSPRLAKQLVRQGRVYWNAGIFIGRVGTFLERIQRFLPDHARHLFPLGKVAQQSAFRRQARSAYRRIRAISFDDGVMAHLGDGSVVEGDFDWEDLGSWESWVRISPNAKPALAVVSHNVRVVSPDRHLVAAIGLRDVIVVHTPDATLVCRTKDAQMVKDMVRRLAHDQRFSRYV